MRWNRLMTVGLAAALAAWALGDDPNPKEILKKADAATKALKGVSYEIKVYGEGDGARQGKLSAKVKAEKVPGSEEDFRINSEGQMDAPGGETRKFNVASDGEQITSIDMAKKTVTRGKADEAAMLLGPATQAFMLEYVHPTPFSDEIGGKSAKHEGVKKIGDVDCDVIFVVYSEDRGQARWYFGQKDNLPRRVDRVDQKMVYEVTNLNPNPKFDADTFKPKTPEGFEEKPFKVADAAPKTKRPDVLAVGTTAPDWNLSTPDGKTVSLKDLRGKVVLMDFWAVWCPPCKMAMPGVQKLHEKFKDKPVAILGINTWEKPDNDPVAFMKEKGFTYGLLMKGDDVAKTYGVSGIPTFYVIGPDGKILHNAVGFDPKGEEKIAEIIEDALKKN